MATSGVWRQSRRGASWAALVLAATLPLVGATTRAAHAAVPEPQFAPYQAVPLPFAPESIAVADFTGDGRKDVVANSVWSPDPQNAFKLFLYAQRPDGSFGQPARIGMSPYDAPYYVTTIAAGDLDGDGRADVAAATSVGIDVFLQRNGTLASPTHVSVPGAMRVKIADLDGDGHADLIVNGTGGVAWLRGAGDGTFGPATTITARKMNVEVGNLDGDTRLDLAGIDGSTLVVLHQRADGSFSSSELTAISGADLAIGDVTGDGRDDVAMTADNNSPWASVAVWPQRADGSLGPAVFYPTYDVPKPIAIADVNGDGRNDVVTLHDGWSQAGVLLQDTSGALGTERLWQTPYDNFRGKPLAVTDVDGDGLTDIVYAELEPRPAAGPAGSTSVHDHVDIDHDVDAAVNVDNQAFVLDVDHGGDDEHDRGSQAGSR